MMYRTYRIENACSAGTTGAATGFSAVNRNATDSNSVSRIGISAAIRRITFLFMVEVLRIQYTISSGNAQISDNAIESFTGARYT